MHKEDVIVTSSKPRAAVRTTSLKSEDGSVIVNHTVHLHSRLPSTDSGIQADGGFDSLSRYKGKSFLSTCSDQGVSTCSSDSTTGMHNSGSSSGYSTDHSQGSSLSELQSPKVVSLPSQSFVASSKPVPPMKPTLTSLSSKSIPLASRPSAPTSSNHSSEPIEITNIKSSGKPKLVSTSLASGTSESSSVKISGISSHSGTPDKSLYANQTVPTSRPAPTQRPSVTNRKSFTSVSATQKPESEYVSTLPSVKVEASDSSVKLSFYKSGISISTNSTSSDNSASSTNTPATTGLNLDPAIVSVQVSETNSKGSTATVFSTPSSTLKLQVLNPTRQGQHDAAKNQGQGCIALTRPLKLGAPSKISIKTIQPTTLSSQPSHLVPSMKPQQQPDQKQPPSSPAKPRPKIAPRPSILAKSASTQPSVVTTSITVNTTTTDLNTAPSSITTTSTPRTVTTTLSTEPPHKTEVPVVHVIKTAPTPAGRTEIPVTHVVHRTPSYKNQIHTRPSSFGRYTPESDKYRHQQSELLNRQPIYENVLFNIRDGFSFDDGETRLKHAELILKQSDELITDALKMLGKSSISLLDAKGNGSSTNSNKFNDRNRTVDGEEPIFKREHRIPVFDVRTGTLHGGSKKSYWAEWTGQLNIPNGENKPEVTWNERKARIDSALSWLKHELADLRDMDNTLISQFKRCQDTIETLKTQREVWEGLSEEGEEGEYWDDYELNEFNRRYLDSPGGSSCSQFSPGSREPSLQDVTPISFPVPKLNLPMERKAANGHGVKQDVEATL